MVYLSDHNSLCVHAISAVVFQLQCHMFSSIVSSSVHEDHQMNLFLFLLVLCSFLVKGPKLLCFASR